MHKKKERLFGEKNIFLCMRESASIFFQKYASSSGKMRVHTRDTR